MIELYDLKPDQMNRVCLTIFYEFGAFNEASWSHFIETLAHTDKIHTLRMPIMTHNNRMNVFLNIPLINKLECIFITGRRGSSQSLFDISSIALAQPNYHGDNTLSTTFHMLMRLLSNNAQHLQQLTLSFHRFQELPLTAIEHLKTTLSALKKLKVIDFDSCYLGDLMAPTKNNPTIPNARGAFISLFKQTTLPALTTLRLTRNSLKKWRKCDLERLQLAMSSQTPGGGRLQEVSFQDNGLFEAPFHFKFFHDVILSQPQLVKIDFSENYIPLTHLNALGCQFDTKNDRKIGTKWLEYVRRSVDHVSPMALLYIDYPEHMQKINPGRYIFWGEKPTRQIQKEHNKDTYNHLDLIAMLLFMFALQGNYVHEHRHQLNSKDSLKTFLSEQAGNRSLMGRQHVTPRRMHTALPTEAIGMILRFLMPYNHARSYIYRALQELERAHTGHNNFFGIARNKRLQQHPPIQSQPNL